MKTIFITIFALFSSMSGFSQFLINGIAPSYDKSTMSFLVSISEDYWGKELTADVCLSDDSDWEKLTIDGIPADNAFTFKDIRGDKTYLIETTVDGENKTFHLQFTFLPILRFERGQFGYDYVNDKVTMQADGGVSEAMNVNVKWRGGTTNRDGRHKRNYTLKFLDENGENQDRTFLGLRNDNKWILDAGQVDLFRMRNLIAAQIWQDFAKKPYYIDKEPKAQTATRGGMVEIFLDDQYQGVFNLCEPIDRKQMKLKKFEKNGIIHGGLWKASSFGDATFWNIPKEYDNTKEQNNVWELKYPEIDDLCPSDYSTLWNAMMFVATASDDDFNNQVDEYFDTPVLMDYYLFVQLTNCFDICGKNIYWAVYDKMEDKKLTPAMWDMDCSMGQNYTDDPLHPNYVAPDFPLLTPNNIFHRLLQLNTHHFKENIIQRYAELREGAFATESLKSRYHDAYHRLLNSGASNREERRWSYDTDIACLKLDFKAELEYIHEWIDNRMDYLDREFSYTPSTILIRNNTPAPKDDRIYTLQGTVPPKNYKGVVISNGRLVIKK